MKKNASNEYGIMPTKKEILSHVLITAFIVMTPVIVLLIL